MLWSTFSSKNRTKNCPSPDGIGRHTYKDPWVSDQPVASLDFGVKKNRVVPPYDLAVIELKPWFSNRKRDICAIQQLLKSWILDQPVARLDFGIKKIVWSSLRSGRY